MISRKVITDLFLSGISHIFNAPFQNSARCQTPSAFPPKIKHRGCYVNWRVSTRWVWLVGIEVLGASQLFEKPDVPEIELLDLLPKIMAV